MRSTFFIAAISLFSINSFSQAPDCFVFPAAGPNYNDAMTYPAGSVLFSSAGIDIVKPATTFGMYPMPGFQYINNTSNEMYFVNQLNLDLSNLTYDCRKLSFDLLASAFAVDDDTLFYNSGSLPALPYTGVGFTVDTISSTVFVVEGDFDMIHFFGSTTALADICVQPCPAENCFQFPAVAGNYNDNLAYPAGSVLMSSAGIDIIKPTTGMGIYPMPGFQFISINSNQLFFINQMDLDLGGLAYTCKKLTFELIYNGFAVDSDTIFESTTSMPPMPYAGAGFTVDTISWGVYEVTGDFNMIHIFGSTSILSNICVEECTGGSCFEFPSSSTENFNSPIDYPAGSVLLSSNGIDLIKPTTTFGIYPMPGTQIVGVNANQILFVNQLDIDLSDLSYSCKELTFELLLNGFAVDNDTIFEWSNALPPLPYVGAGFTVDTISNGYYQVTGDFTTIHIFGSTTILSNICVEQCPVGGCFEFVDSTSASFNNPTLYPAGSILLSSNGIDLVKPSATFGIYPSAGTQIIDVNSTEILFINQLDIDVSAVTYNCKKLTFDLLFNGFAVDNDTIFEWSNALPVLPYSGAGFTVDTTSANVYVITGQFDVIHTFGSTTILSDICIEPCSTVGLETKLPTFSDWTVYPNPTSGTLQFNFTAMDELNLTLTLIDLNGRITEEPIVLNGSGIYSSSLLEEKEAGIYFVQLVNEHGEIISVNRVILVNQ